MDLTTILVSFCLFSALITYGLGIAVWSRDPGSPVNRLFLLAMFGASYWAAGEFMIWQSAGYDAVSFWLKVSAFWTVAIMLTLHFVLAFTGHPLAKKENLKYLIVFLYIPAVLVSLVIIFTESIYTVVPAPWGSYMYVPVTASPAYIGESLLFLVVMIIALYIGFSSWTGQGPGRIRRQNLLVSIGIVFVVLTGTLSAFILPALQIHLPNTVFIGIVCFSGIISYAMIRLGLFTLSPESAAARIIQTMPDGLILADTSGKVVAVNPPAETLLGKKQEQIIGRPAEAILPWQSVDAIRDAIRERDQVCDMEAVLDTPVYRVVSIAGSRVTGPEGEPAGMVLIIHDITARKTAERTLRLAKEKIALLSQLTRHDITNLVTGLSGYILLLSERTTDPASRQYLAACTGILAKIDRHLQFSREYQEIGKHEPVWQQISMVMARAKSDIVPSRAEIAYSLPPVSVFADPLLVKVVYNLLENALRHGGETLTLIRVFAQERPDRSLLLVFEDNGIGIPPEDKELIFTQGYGKNTGLGLALSREILAMTDISIAETGLPGAGARFELCIPPQSWKKS